MTDAAAHQAAEEVGRAAWRLAPFLGPEAGMEAQRTAATAAKRHVGLLTGPDEDLAGEAALDILAVIWGDGQPTLDWWDTPLGRCVASVGALEGSDAVPATVAAAMLGISKGRVTQLCDAGKLDRHPDGGITRMSIAHRLANP